MLSRSHRRIRWIIPLFLAPAFIVYTLFYMYPAVDAFRISLYDWTGFGNNATYVGLKNFGDALRDRFVRMAFGNNVLIMFAGGALLFLLALYFAVILTTPAVKGRRLLRTVLFFPYTINAVGIAFLWLFILNPRFGLLNGTLEALGLDNLALIWLGRRDLAMGSMIWVIIWMSIGFYTILLQAGIDNIPKELIDAARVDGAQGFAMFWRITLPLLRDVMAIALTYWIIEALQIFGIVFAMTRGAPAGETHTVATYMYSVALPQYNPILRFGYGTAIAVLQFLLVVAASSIYFRLIRREAVEF
jgi:raffinose/stachyose/melibiose transport system permease protein